MAYHDEPLEATLSDLESDERGLSEATARRRLERHGPNALPEAGRRSALSVLLAQFRSALVLVLVGAAALSVWAGHAVDAILIAIILVANGVLGFVQEYRAERSLLALRELAAPTAIVVRDGEEREIDARAVVPGDVIVLRQGDAVAADARLLEAADLEVDESSLTGESLPVGKTVGSVPADAPLAERTNTVYRGTTVTRGRGLAVVVATGIDTELGEIATELIGAEERATPFGRELDRLGTRIGIGVVALSALVVPALVLRGTSILQAGLTAVSLAVAAIPEGLPAVVTLTLALGVRRMADENALVRTLPAVESLGAVTTVCTDKTGTLTTGRMAVRRLWVHDESIAFPPDCRDEWDERLERLLETAVLCNDATDHQGDPTERALVDAGEAYGLDVESLRAERPRTDERPFSAERKLMTTIHDETAYVKGAPAAVLDRSNRILTADGVAALDETTREMVRERQEAFASDALRVLGFAYADSPGEDPESNLVFVGLAGLADPPRPEVRDAIAETKRAGIDVKMITGDDRTTARAIAAQVGIETTVMEGREIEGLDGEDLRRTVAETDVFARAEPSHKVAILRALQDDGHVVAMTGDGVNDAPALKQTDVGVAMGERGTDVARESSDVILLDDNYATIASAIRRGRTIYDNVWKFVAYLLSANLAEVLLVFVASLFGYLILPPVQLLWINLLTDGLPALAIGTDPPSGDVMARSPRKGGAILDRTMAEYVLAVGVTATIVLLGVTYLVLDDAPSVTPYAMTMVFTGFVVFEFEKLFVVRWAKDGSLVPNRWLFAAVGVSVLAHLSLLYTPLSNYFGTVALGLADWGLLVGAMALALPPFVAASWVVRRRMESAS